MKRDNDLIRKILLDLESDTDWVGLPSDDGEDSDRELYHYKLLCDAGLLTQEEFGFRLTNAGHDFIEAMRDEGIWKKTKDAVAQTGGNATLEIVKQIATEFLKKQIKDRTGLDV